MLAAYDWLRDQMKRRIPGYEGHYPWWGYEHFLDLRFYRWHVGEYGVRLVRLGLAVPRERVLASAYGAWHCVLNRGYLPASLVWEEYEQALDAWEAEVRSHGSDDRQNPLPEPWESQMRASWERIFDVEARRPRETIQVTFERLDYADVVDVTEFTSHRKRDW